MHIAEVVTIAKSLPLLRLNTYKSLILSYSADYRRIFPKKNIYFGSISAIFETLTEKQVGITKSSLLHAGLVDDIAKYTKRAMIIQSRLITCTRKG